MHSVIEKWSLEKAPEKSLGVPHKNSQITLLIVDDDSVNRIVLKSMLIKYGYTVIVAEDGSQAVDIFDESEPDLVLMDVMMPEMDGYEATKKIKAKSKGQYIPIMFLTAVLDDNALVKCVDAGGDDFLSKPYNPVILKAKIDALLRTRELYNAQQLQNEVLSRQEQEMQADLDIADRILSKISSKESLDIGNINYYMSPMEQLNGDIIFAQNKPDGGQRFMLGDFTGHGLGAAIGGLVVFDVFKTMTAKGFSVTRTISEINRKLCELLPVGRFLAVGFVELDPDCGLASIWNCGLPDIYLLGKKGGVDGIYHSNNLPLGVLPEHELDFSFETAVINPDNKILLYSDGVTESENESSEMYGSKKFEELVGAIRDTEKLIPTILDNINFFTGGGPQTDDVSLLEIICDKKRIKQKQDESKGNTQLPATSWNMNLVLHLDAIKGINVVPVIAQIVVDMQGLHHCRESIYFIISELYSNAVEHGLLELDSTLKLSADGMETYQEERNKSLKDLNKGTINLNLTHEPDEQGGKLTVNLRHDGDGYDISTMQSLQEESQQIDSASGIRVIKSLCESLEYEDFGRSVEVKYIWQNNNGEVVEND